MKPLNCFLLTILIFISICSYSQTYVSGYITEDTQWDSIGSPYIIVDSLIVNDTLRIEDGTVVMFKYHPDEAKKSYMVVNRGVEINSDSNNPVIFTSERDNSLGELKGTSKTTIPKPGDWGYIIFNEEVSDELPFRGVEFRYGGGRNPDSVEVKYNYPMVIYPNNYYRTIDDCKFLYSQGVGLKLGKVDLSNCIISDCYYGIQLTSSESNFDNVVVRNSKAYPIFFNNLQLHYNDEETSLFGDNGNDITFENNGEDYFAMGGEISFTRATQYYEYCLWDKLSIPYLITDPLIIKDQNIVVENGALVKFKYYADYSKKPFIYLDDESSLSSSDSNSDKIVFTSEYDHDYDYEYFEGDHPAPQTDDWGYIKGNRIDLSNCVFNYGGVFYSTEDEQILNDSSAVIRTTVGTSGYTKLRRCIFSNLYNNAINAAHEYYIDHQFSIDSCSFLIDKQNYAINAFIIDSVNYDPYITAQNNYWYGGLGPYHPETNKNGNGCKVSDYVVYEPFLKSSDDSLALVSSVISGIVTSTEGDTLSDVLVKLTGKSDKFVLTDSNGRYYISNVYPGYGYELEFFSTLHKDSVFTDVEVLKDTAYIIDVSLIPKKIDYLIDTITFKVNPELSEIQVGGSVHRYYKIIDKTSRESVYGAEVFVNGLDDTYFSNYKGIVDIEIPWDMVGNSAPTTKDFYISQIGAESLPYSESDRVNFSVNLEPHEYEKKWGGKLWLKEGISVVEINQEAEAGIGLVVKDNGLTEVPSNLIIERGSKVGAGINLSASAKAKFGSLEAGAEASVGANISAIVKDDFLYDYENINGEYALAKFLTLAGSAFTYLDSPLLRFFGVALLGNNPYIDEAAVSNSIGVVFSGEAGAGAGISGNVGDEELPVGAELKGSLKAEGKNEFLFTAYSHTSQLDFKLSHEEEYEVGVSSALALDITKLFGDDDDENKDNKDTKSDSDDKTEDDKKDDDNKLEIKIPDILSLSASGGGKFGASIGTYRNIDNPYTTLGFMYGYKYSAKAELIGLFDVGVAQEREYHFSFDFHDDLLKSILEDKVSLVKELTSTDISDLDLDISSMSGASFFSEPFTAFAEEQVKNAFSFPPVPYNHTVKDLIGDGAFEVSLSFGLGPVKCSFGGGISYTEENEYLWKSGVFYNWKLYPLQTYDYVEQNNSYTAKDILQDILNESGDYLWEEAKENIFKKIAIWPLSLLLKSTKLDSIPLVPDSERLSYLMADTITSQDSIFVYYWDWYGTDGVPVTKSTLKSTQKNTFQMVKDLATEVHKLDYGIGGFYQFEPNGKLVEDSAVLTIHYFDEELEVMLSDSSLYQINEMDLCMYVEDKANSSWVYIGGVVDTLKNTVTARIDSFATFTLAPFVPASEMVLTSNKDTIYIETSDTAIITSNILYYNTGEIINNDEEFTIGVSRGTIDAVDVNSSVDGIQVAAIGGKIEFNYIADSISGIVYIKAESRKGQASDAVKVFINEQNPPDAPLLTTANLNDYNVSLEWEPSEAIDVSGYYVYYGTKQGGPYNGTASVLGEDSPVDIGTLTSTQLAGLYKDSTYYFVIKAIDRCGNESEYSNEMELQTEFNHQPIIYARVFNVEPLLTEGTVIDTLWADDEDKDQQLRFYFAGNNTCTAFSLDSISGELKVADAEQLDYWNTGVETFTMIVGVRDDAKKSLSDSTEVIVNLKIATGIPEYITYDSFELNVYPNPAKEIINIEGEFDRIMMYDLAGKLVKSTKEKIMYVSDIEQGIYFLRAVYRGKTQVKKIVIQ